MRKRVKFVKKLRFRTWVIITFIIICLIGVVYSSYNIIIWKLSVDENHKITEKLNKVIVKIDDKYNIDFKDLKEKNKDTIAYVNVNNTNIDFVVVKGEDNEYYLRHNFDNNWNIAGWIFADYHNRFDESDRNIIIYGHDTKDGSMFGTLRNVLEKDWYENEDNHKIVLVTEKGTYYYQVFSTYSIKAEDYYINTEFNNDEEFNEFINKLKSRSIYDYGLEVSGEDKMLTLSSCMGDATKRVVLHAKLIEKETN